MDKDTIFYLRTFIEEEAHSCSMELDSVIFESKEGTLSRLASSNERSKVERVTHEEDGILTVKGY